VTPPRSHRLPGAAPAAAATVATTVHAALATAVTAAILLQAACLALPQSASALAFTTAPALPALPTVALNARAQVTNAQMNNFGVSSLLGESGWNLTVAGNTAAGMSPVFAQYCPNSAGCGANAFGYVPGGATLPADSLTLNTAGASFTTLLGGPATFACNSTPCAIDSPTPSTIATESTGAIVATWTTTGFSTTGLALSTPTTLKLLPASEVYRVNVVWTLNTGP
jgi:hypothetical protein